MTSGMLFALAISALVVAVLFGLVRRQRGGPKSKPGDSPNTMAQWTEGETTRLLSSAEVPGLYLLRSRFLSKAEGTIFLLLKAAFPRDQKLEIIKQRCLQAAQVKYICVYPPQLPRYRELREQILGPAADFTT